MSSDDQSDHEEVIFVEEKKATVINGLEVQEKMGSEGQGAMPRPGYAVIFHHGVN